MRPAPRTVPRIVRPVPQTGRVVDGVRVMAVATRCVVKARSVLRVTPAAFAATTRTW